MNDFYSNQAIIRATAAAVVKSSVAIPKIFESFPLANLPMIVFEFAMRLQMEINLAISYTSFHFSKGLFMPVPMQKFREAVFQMLYSYDIGGSEEEDIIELLMKELAISKKVLLDAQERVLLIRTHLQKIDKMIANTSQSYAFDRIQSVERNILRLGIYELFYDNTIPAKVALAEAMRLTRKFGTREAASFVNAILDNVYKASLGEEVDAGQLTRSAEDLAKSEVIALEAALNPPQKTTEDDEDA